MIYIVEDDKSIRDIEIYTLKQTGFQAVGAGCASELYAAMKNSLPDLILLDVMLPGEDGVTILKKLKSSETTSSIPVIMATARGEEYDKVTSLDQGADDYLVKPFGMMEMVSRVRAVLRRSGKKEKDSRILKSGGLLLDQVRHIVTVNGETVILALKEYQVLEELMLHPGMVFTRDQLLSDLWDTEYDGETRTVDVHMRTLRKKLGPCGDRIETVRGVGYRISGEEK